MLTKFLEGVGGKLADQWLAALWTPASMFWLGGMAVYAGFCGSGWNAFWKSLDPFATPTKILAIILGLLVITISAYLGKQVELPLLRLLEGYWPHWNVLRDIRAALVGGVTKRFDEAYATWNNLKEKEATDQKLNIEELIQLRKLEWKLRGVPLVPAERMPSKLGNIIRASEVRPWNYYGLDAVICWPTFWLIVPQDTKMEIREARAAIDNGVRLFMWAALFLIWCSLSVPWYVRALVILGSIITMLYSYYGLMLTAAWSYGELLEATFVVHRTTLYTALRWPAPSKPEGEEIIGKQVTQYLWRGEAPTNLVFTEAEKKVPKPAADPRPQTVILQTTDALKTISKIELE